MVATNLLDIIFVMATSSWTVALWCRSAVMPGCKGMMVSEPLTRAAWSETVIEMPRQWQMAVILHLYVNDHLVVVHKIFSHGVVKRNNQLAREKFKAHRNCTQCQSRIICYLVKYSGLEWKDAQRLSSLNIFFYSKDIKGCWWERCWKSHIYKICHRLTKICCVSLFR